VGEIHTTNTARQVLVRGTDSGLNVYDLIADLGRFKGTSTGEDLFLRAIFMGFFLELN
jgi:hypothetical protein